MSYRMDEKHIESLVPLVPDSNEAKVILELSPKVTRKKQIVPSKRWCFTFNNYTDPETAMLLDLIRSCSADYIIGREVGEEGTPHLQGYLEFKKKLRPLSVIKFTTIHWEKAKGTRAQNIEYCSKEGDYVTTFKIDKPLVLIEESRFYEWQLELFKILLEPADERTIYWYWDVQGNVGKSAFAKLMCARYDALMVEGKANDINQGIAGYKEEKGYFPTIIIVDCPRHSLEYMNYSAIEKVKNGLVFSGKYESKQMIFNCPHIVVFANAKPDVFKFSADRWKIKKITIVAH